MLGQDAVRYAPELIALGPASYSIAVDATTGNVLARVAALDGAPAKGQSLSDVESDGRIDEAMFAIPD